MGMRIEANLNFAGLEADLDALAPEALTRAMEHIQEVAVELTPLEEGTLRRSAKVTLEGNGQAAITFDGPYARYQHERLDLRHETGQAKYLEQPMVTEAQKALEILAHQLGKAI